MRYEIQGNPFPVAIVYLEPEESVICQKGAMVWMTPNVSMQTNTGGGFGSMFKRAVSGEALFQNEYTAKKTSGMITFGSSVPGEIMAVEMTPGKQILAQKSAFLASSKSVNYEIAFQRKISSGFFGGEGFIMQKFSGSGMLLLEIDGSVIEYELGIGESMLIDTGYLAAMDATCSIDIEQIKGIGNVLVGGEGLFNTRVTGPGHIWLQTMPVSQLAASIRRYIPSGN